MKVGIFIPDSLPDEGGGYTFEYDVLENIGHLAAKSPHEFTIFTPRTSKGLLDFLSLFPDIRIRRTENAIPFWIRIPWKIKRMLIGQQQYLGDLNFTAQKYDIDFVWFITPFFQPVDIPYMVTVWDLQHRLQPWFPEVGNYHEWLSRENYYTSMIQRAAYVITGNQTGANEIVSFYQIPHERIKLLPHPTPSFTAKIQPQPGIVSEKFQIKRQFLLYPAQFWAHKNHANLLHAFHILREKYNVDIDLVLVGSEKGNKAYIQKMISTMQLDEYVHVLGFVSRDELVALYKGAFALVYPSFFGPENLPPLEAFSLGCPVVAAMVDGASEQLGDAALLVDPKDPVEIASAIKKLVDDPMKRNELIVRGHERAKNWTGEHFVKAGLEILDQFESIRHAWK
jgi:glycosyltransferase involved in cell wall biosynthesis